MAKTIRIHIGARSKAKDAGAPKSLIAREAVQLGEMYFRKGSKRADLERDLRTTYALSKESPSARLALNRFDDLTLHGDTDDSCATEAKDTGSVEGLDADDVFTKYGATFLATVNVKGSAKAPDGGVVRKVGGRYTRTRDSCTTEAKDAQFKGYEIRKNSLNGKWFVYDPLLKKTAWPTGFPNEAAAQKWVNEQGVRDSCSAKDVENEKSLPKPGDTVTLNDPFVQARVMAVTARGAVQVALPGEKYKRWFAPSQYVVKGGTQDAGVFSRTTPQSFGKLAAEVRANQRVEARREQGNVFSVRRKQKNGKLGEADPRFSANLSEDEAKRRKAELERMNPNNEYVITRDACSAKDALPAFPFKAKTRVDFRRDGEVIPEGAEVYVLARNQGMFKVRLAGGDPFYVGQFKLVLPQ